ncbi:MAG TPA: MlaD family protein, partial [Candidatus Angelobacter sp.]
FSNEQWGHHVVPYRTYLRYVGGVEPGSPVLYGGIAAGKVSAVRAWNEDPTKIHSCPKQFELSEKQALL